MNGVELAVPEDPELAPPAAAPGAGVDVGVELALGVGLGDGLGDGLAALNVSTTSAGMPVVSMP